MTDYVQNKVRLHLFDFKNRPLHRYDFLKEGTPM
jgi:hypothetical protein